MLGILRLAAHAAAAAGILLVLAAAVSYLAYWIGQMIMSC